MERLLAMNSKLRTLLATALLLGGLTASVPLASADIEISIGDQDAEQGDVQANDCANYDESLAGALGCDTSDKVTDFTDYTGSLEEPDASGYDSALTETTNARDFIQKVVNFALSFVGLICVVSIIYGGLLYVTSRGEEEPTSKAKKTITYSVIGIVIILGSFAFVNTILQVGGGSTGGDGTGTALNGETINESGAAFDVQDVLDEIEQITTDYIDAYDTLLAVNKEIASMQALEAPVVVTVSANDYSLGGVIEFGMEAINGQDDEFTDTYTVLDQAEVDDYMNSLARASQNIMAETDSLSDAYEDAYQLYQYLQNGNNNLVSDSDPEAEACNYADFSTSTGKLSSGLGWSTTDADVQAVDPDICNYISAIAASTESDYLEVIGEAGGSTGLIPRFEELNALFDVNDNVGGSNLEDIVGALSDAQTSLETAKTTINNKTIQEIQVAMNDLYVQVKDVQFVQVQLSATVVEGNAPLLVRFDILGTEDPSGNTVQEDQIEWDLDGDGEFDESDIGEDLGADSISNIFETAGTYRVKVRVLSSEPNIAAGVSTISIKVSPAKSLIIIKATVGSDEQTIADFSKTPAINNAYFKVTATEASSESGIYFDASATTDGDGNSSGVTYYEWDFGDSETLAGNASEASTARHFYTEQGKYDVSLTVTDQDGVKDSKFFQLYVATPAARIEATPASGISGTTFTLDGSSSTADVGSIKSYQWSLTNSDGTAVSLSPSTGNSLQVPLTDPGVYDVNLSITDTSSKSDSATAFLVVESQAPVVTYKYTIENENQPSVVTFDARDSYDPDPKDTLTYSWDFGGFEDEDYVILEQSEDLSQMTVQFLKIGSYTVVLTGHDQHAEVIQKSDTATTTISIDSILDVDLTINGDGARHLNEAGEVDVEFTGETEFGSAFQIEYGDGETDFTDNLTNGKSIFTHTYKQAGVYYVKLTTYDDAEDEQSNSDTTRVYIGAGNTPIAVIGLGTDGVDIGSGPIYVGSTKTKFTFTAESSVNVDGTDDNLTYSWNFADGTTASQSKVTHVFDEQATYKVTLTVKDKKNPTISDQTTVTISVEGIEPEIKGITVVPETTTEPTTPLKVNLSVSASDEDGKLTFIKAWYYDVDDSATKLGTVTSNSSSSFTLTIKTNGEEGEAKQYGFGVEVTDNDNQTVSSVDQLEDSDIPLLSVINGPNDTPVAAFTVDKSSVFVGEKVTFSSVSYDTDGDIAKYWWDIEGDGFYNNEATESSSYTYTYSQVHSEGINVGLKVEDNEGATAESETVTIAVDSLAGDPDAKFLANINGTTVQFSNNSFIDTDQGAELAGSYWDFDLDTDSDGNGVKDDDYDSYEENPSHTYSKFGTYKVKMTVVDTVGQSDTVTLEVEVKETAAPVAAFTSTVLGTTATFKNTSTVDTTNNVDVRSYTWDMDTSVDSNGDTDTENDADKTEKNPSFEYSDFGSYEVKLTIVDSYGKTDSVTQTVEVSDPIQPLNALFTSVPQANSLSQIILQNDGEEVTFYFSAEGGSEDYSYVVDKNIFYDTNGDGVRDNDKDYTSKNSGSWKTPFYTSYGQVVAKLTVTDDETGETDVATLQVVFEGNLGSANLFNATPKEMALLILSALLTTIFGVGMAFRYKPLPSR